MIELTIGFDAAVRRSAAMACALATFCSSSPVGSTNRVPVRFMESAMAFIRRTNSSRGTPQERTSALVATLSELMSAACRRSRTVISSWGRMCERLECRTSSGSISTTWSNWGWVWKNTSAVMSLVRLATGYRFSGFFWNSTRFVVASTT
jgi:hypothetical protein